MSNFLGGMVNIFLHLDKNLAVVISQYGTATYLLLFGIVFMETGFVVTPFLPGDSLLFAGGALSAISLLQIWPVYGLFLVAAILGDTVNYWIGHQIGPRISEREGRFIKKEYFVQAQEFYKKHGNMAIVLARFIPIVRTFAPFVAGIAKMSYKHFITYNIVGGVLWVSVFTWSGYFFGNLPFVKENFHYIVVVIILLSVAPIMYEAFKSITSKSKNK